MRHKEITIEPKLFADILVVIGFVPVAQVSEKKRS
jgi:hypothetical protein